MFKYNDGQQLLHCLFDVQKMEHKHCSEKYAYDVLVNKSGGTMVKAGIQKSIFAEHTGNWCLTATHSLYDMMYCTG